MASVRRLMICRVAIAALMVGWLFSVSGCSPSPDNSNGLPKSSFHDLSSGMCTQHAESMTDALSTVDTLLSDWRHSNAIPGLSAGAICGDSLVWAGGYGVMALDDLRPVTPKTLFRIASLTKLFTATAKWR